MVKTYLDILSERGIRPFLTDEAFEELQKFDYKSQYAIPGQVMPVFKHPNQHKIELGKTTNLIGDMCWYGASVEELVRSIKYAGQESRRKGVRGCTYCGGEESHGLGDPAGAGRVRPKAYRRDRRDYFMGAA